MALLLLFIIVLVGFLVNRRRKVTINVIHFNAINPLKQFDRDEPLKESEMWDGPVPTPAQEEKNKQAIFEIIEKYPNGFLATANPEYVEEYLGRIDLDLPDNITISK